MIRCIYVYVCFMVGSGLLLAQDVDFTRPPHEFYAPLHFAVWSEDVKKVKELLKEKKIEDHGEFINSIDQRGATPLDYAIARDNLELVKFLLKKKANPNFRNKVGWTPVFTAFACLRNKKNLKICKEIYKYKPDLDHRCLTPGYTASQWLELMSVELLQSFKLGKEYHEYMQGYKGNYEEADRERFETQRMEVTESYQNLAAECHYFLTELLNKRGIKVMSHRNRHFSAWLDDLIPFEPFKRHIHEYFVFEGKVQTCRELKEPLRDFFKNARKNKRCLQGKSNLQAWVHETSLAVEKLGLPSSKLFFLSLFFKLGYGVIDYSNNSEFYLTLEQWVDLIEEGDNGKNSFENENFIYLLRVKSKELMKRFNEGYSLWDFLDISHHHDSYPSSGDIERKKSNDDQMNELQKKQDASFSQEDIDFIHMLQKRGQAMREGSSQGAYEGEKYQSPVFIKPDEITQSESLHKELFQRHIKKLEKIDKEKLVEGYKFLENILQKTPLKTLIDEYVFFQKRQYHFGLRMYDRGISDPDILFRSPEGHQPFERKLVSKLSRNNVGRYDVVVNEKEKKPKQHLTEGDSPTPMRISKKHESRPPLQPLSDKRSFKVAKRKGNSSESGSEGESAHDAKMAPRDRSHAISSDVEALYRTEKMENSKGASGDKPVYLSKKPKRRASALSLHETELEDHGHTRAKSSESGDESSYNSFISDESDQEGMSCKEDKTIPDYRTLKRGLSDQTLNQSNTLSPSPEVPHYSQKRKQKE